MSPTQERAQKVRALMGIGLRPATWSIEKIQETYAKEFGGEPEPKPEPKPAPAPAPKAPKVEEIKGDDASQLLSRLAGLLGKGGAGLGESEVIALINKHSKSRTVEVVNHTRETKIELDTVHYAFDEALLMLSTGSNVYMHGPAGSGKTTIAEQCAQALGLEFYFTGAVLQKYELTGFVDAGGNYQRTAFRDAFEHGGVFLFDEMDASGAQALIAFNAAIANGVCAFPDKIVRKHDDFLVIAASNTRGAGADSKYIRNKLDAATLDRYVFIAIGYDETLERDLAVNTAVDKALGALWAETVQSYRARAALLGIDELISPRATMQGIKLLNAGMTMARVAQCTVFEKMSEDNAISIC